MAVFVGLDVGAKTVAMASRRQGKRTPHEPIAQTPQGHREAVCRLRALKPTRVVLEATGIYYLDLALALVEAGLPVAVINGRSLHQAAQMKLGVSKTDALDAALLAEYAERMTPSLWTPPEMARLQLRDLGRQINRLTGVCAQAKNRLHALKAKRATATLLIEDEQEGIAQLKARITRLREAALALIVAEPPLGTQLQHLCAAKGIGEGSAIALLAELLLLPSHLKAAQVSRHAGLDGRLYQSGTSVHKAARLSKTGNAYLRAALYMPALSAVRHDPHVKAFYEALQRRGKKKIQALCAVMRKYLTGLWACLQQGVPFDSSKLFNTKHHLEA